MQRKRRRVGRREPGVRTPGHRGCFIKAERAQGGARRPMRGAPRPPAPRSPPPGLAPGVQTGKPAPPAPAARTPPAPPASRDSPGAPHTTPDASPCTFPRLLTPRKPEGLPADPAHLSHVKLPSLFVQNTPKESISLRSAPTAGID